MDTEDFLSVDREDMPLNFLFGQSGCSNPHVFESFLLETFDPH